MHRYAPVHTKTTILIQVVRFPDAGPIVVPTAYLHRGVDLSLVPCMICIGMIGLEAIIMFDSLAMIHYVE